MNSPYGPGPDERSGVDDIHFHPVKPRTARAVLSTWF